MDRKDETERWSRLLLHADALMEKLESTSNDRVRTIDELEIALSCVLEVFPRSIEPLDDFPGFAVRRFAKAIREGVLALQIDTSECSARRLM